MVVSILFSPHFTLCCFKCHPKKERLLTSYTTCLHMAFPCNKLVGTLLEFSFMWNWDEVSIKFIKICSTKKLFFSRILRTFKAPQLTQNSISRERTPEKRKKKKNRNKNHTWLFYFTEGKYVNNFQDISIGPHGCYFLVWFFACLLLGLSLFFFWNM